MAKTLELREFKGHAENIYKAVVISAQRARQIHAKLSEELRKQIGEIENEEELDENNVDREEIVKKFDKIPKPSTTAIGEYLAGQLHVIKE